MSKPYHPTPHLLPDYTPIQTRVVDDEYDLVADMNVDIPLKATRGHPEGLVRANLFRSKGDVEKGTKLPVLVTYGPYGKDVPYEDFRKPLYDELPPGQKTKWSAWETPEPTFWTRYSYAILRVDERGIGQSPGYFDALSSQTASDFAQVIEWASEQNEWCNGKVGLAGISYYAATQWMAAALRPKGLAAIIPWEGYSDYYRDSTRHAGILSHDFIKWWWDVQVAPNQYGLPGKAARKWGADTIECALSEEELRNNRATLLEEATVSHYLSQPHFSSRVVDLSQIQVPVLSVANWGGILLHLRGNVEGYVRAGTEKEKKWLRFITGRHDLPFYLEEGWKLQMGFLDAFLKGDDHTGWLSGQNPRVVVTLRKGNPGYNKTEADSSFLSRAEDAWPLPSTRYEKWGLTKEGVMEVGKVIEQGAEGVKTWPALSAKQVVTFTTPPSPTELEITGHIVVHLTVSLSPSSSSSPPPKDLDLFLTLRHFDADGKEIFYTGTVGDPIPVCKGWLRCSLRKVNEKSELHRSWLPRREYREEDVEYLKVGEKYQVDVEMWPTNVVVSPGNKLQLEVSGADTQGHGIFLHNGPQDRTEEKFGGNNHIHFGPGCENYVVMPVIPAK